MATLNLAKLNECVYEHVGANGTTLDAVAGKLGITRVSLWSKLHGKTRFYADELFVLADLIGHNVNDFRG